MSLQRDVIGIPGVEKLSPEDLGAIVSTADSLGIDPDWLLAIEKFESGLNPKAVNSSSGATGAIQFMPGPNGSAARLGTSTEALKQMTLQEQQKYVYAYLLPFKSRLKSLEDTYLAVFFPAAIGQSDDYVVGISPDNGGSSFQNAVYNQNKGFDSSSTGYVRRSDIVSTIRSVYRSGSGRPRIPVPGSEALWRTLALFGAAGIATAFIVKWGLSK